MRWSSSRTTKRFFLPYLLVSAIAGLFFFSSRNDGFHLTELDLEKRYPLLWRHVHTFNGTGGAWYIPPSWLSDSVTQPKTISEAAIIASRAAKDNKRRQIPYSSIPLLLHQTWKNRRIDTWSELLCSCVESWLDQVISNDMAYFLWEDDSIFGIMAQFEPELLDYFTSLPSNVERADVLRIFLLQHLGGIYADIDTQPLLEPTSWISSFDLATWTDPVTMSNYSSNTSVEIILGIEADCLPNKDDYWRMGYSYPIQLTQWALASSPNHAILRRYMETLSRQLKDVATRHMGRIDSLEAVQELKRIGPVSLTGPVAITIATKTWLEEQIGLRWNALTGLLDGGRSKVVENVLILPITGFSPGRGWYGNMGSKAIEDPSARVLHHAQGSWHSFNIQVEFTKLCRTLFGLCRDRPINSITDYRQ